MGGRDRHHRPVDALELLELEAETIWSQTPDGLGSGTVCVLAATYDGRSNLLAGAARLTPLHPTAITAARCWTLTPGPPLPPVPPGLALVSEGKDARPPTGWEPDEWQSLLTGERGPWAALAEGDHVVSLAHSARLTDRAAEVGVQTEDGYQGRALASLVVRAWTNLMAGTGRVLFYSAFEANIASHRVAETCGAVPIGMLCRLGAESFGSDGREDPTL